MKTADLHTHSRYSDGTNTPRQLVELAAAAGLSAIALTDHDILDGLPEAETAAQELGIELVPGLELSSAWRGREAHMLGFYLNFDHAPFQQLLATQRRNRIDRIHQMVKKLQQAGLAIEPADVFAMASHQGAVGRLHVAQALVKRGHVKTPEEAFDRYIGNNGPGFIPGSSLTSVEAIRAIRDAGGIPVLAHPIYLRDDAIIDYLAGEGLLGVEAYHSSHNPETVARYEHIAKRLGLLRTGGTDYHGSAKEGVPIGQATVSYELVEALKAWKHTHAT